LVIRVGDEEVVSTSPRFSAYHNFIFQWIKDYRWQYLSAFDVGHQSQQQNNGEDDWTTKTLTIRRVLNSEQSLAFNEYPLDNIKRMKAVNFNDKEDRVWDSHK